MNRRNFIAGILAASASPAIVRAASLMPVKALPSGVLLPWQQEVATWLGVDMGHTSSRSIGTVWGNVIDPATGAMHQRLIEIHDIDTMDRIRAVHGRNFSIGYRVQRHP